MSYIKELRYKNIKPQVNIYESLEHTCVNFRFSHGRCEGFVKTMMKGVVKTILGLVGIFLFLI